MNSTFNIGLVAGVFLKFDPSSYVIHIVNAVYS